MKEKKRNYCKYVFFSLFSLIFSFFLLRENFRAEWGIIDDHEIAYFLGSDKRISVTEIPHLLSTTEVGQFGKTPRLRPSYYLMRITESMLFKDNPHLWYLVLYLILSLFIFAILYIASNYFGAIPAVIFSLYIMTPAYWKDIWARLGPGEIYVVLGLSLLSLGLYKIVRSKKRVVFPWILYFLGAMIATGSKENMVILALPSIFLIWKELRNKEVDWKISLPILHVVYCAFITVGILLAIGKFGQNIYAEPISSSTMPQVLSLSIAKTTDNLRLWLIACISIIILIIYKVTGKEKELRKIWKRTIGAVFIALFCLLVYFSQFVFYLGKWPTSVMRYDFPGIFAGEVFWLSCLYAVYAFSTESSFLKNRIRLYISRTLILVFFGYLVFLTAKSGYSALINATKANADKTVAFTKTLVEVLNQAKKYPDYKIIMKSNNPWDYEPVFSLDRFLRFEGVENSLAVDYEEPVSATNDALLSSLSKTLNELSTEGSVADSKVGFEPLNYKRGNKSCILLLLSGDVGNYSCEFIYHF